MVIVVTGIICRFYYIYSLVFIYLFFYWIIGIASTQIFDGDIYPTVGLISPNECVEINFGLKPFIFDIEQYAKVILFFFFLIQLFMRFSSIYY
jgi:hypothetical protein